MTLPSGTVTLLLADVEGSTRMWETSSQQTRSAMSELDALVDELVGRFGGALPRDQGEGDSFLAAFARASDAVACALEFQRRLRDGPLRIRMGLHTGEVALRGDERYDGPTVIRAARIRDLGHGGQVLLSGATCDVVQDALPDGADTVDLGPHQLKGLDRPVRVFQLTHPDLVREFPPLRSAPTRAGNLPVRLTSFIGRTQELEDVRALTMENRLVTLTGAGGCGKTRMAEEVAGRIADDFGDGVWFCDLGPVADPSVVPQTLRTAMGLGEQANRSDTDVVCAALADARALVILDNCEHLIDASAELAHAVLRACPSTHVLATSRESLGVEGEVSWRVPSLDPGDATALFVEVAKRARAGFAIDAENAEAIEAICARLDGIPLALELAAARIRVLSAQDIAAGLSDRFRLLGRGARTALARHQTLLASVAWSHDLLSDPERIVLRRLAVFAGAFSLEGAETVASGDDVKPAQILELVSQLVERSLLVASDSPTGTRYRMLETIRQFARERLVEAGEARDVSTRHLEYYAGWTVQKRRDFFGGRIAADGLVAELDAAYDNLREAVEWAIVDGHAEHGLRLVTAVQGVWVAWRTATRGHEGQRWLSDLLALEADVSARTRVNALLAVMDDFVTHRETLEALAIARELGDQRLLARASYRAGFTMILTEPERGLQLLEEAAGSARATGDELTLWLALFGAAQVRGWCGDRAIAESREALEIAVRNGGFGEQWSRLALGMSLFQGGEVADGRREIEAAVDLFLVGDRSWVGKSEPLLALTIAAQGDRDLARERAQHAERFTLDGDYTDAESALFVTRLALAIIALDEQRFDAAEEHLAGLQDALDTLVARAADVARDILGKPSVNALRAALAVGRGDLQGARSALEAAVADQSLMHPMALLWVTLWSRCAAVARALGEVSEAEAYVQNALEHIARGAWVFAPDVLEVCACLRTDVSADVDAARLFGAADAGRRQMGIVRPPHPIADPQAALELVHERLGEVAFEEAWNAGADLEIQDAVALAMRGRGPRQRPPSGWDSLTPTERQVVDLVAEGLTNKQIGERLFVSPRTVSTHLSHVFAKLGVSTRSELTSAAAKRT